MYLLIIILPLLSSMFCGFGGRNLGYSNVKIFSCSLIFVCIIVSLFIFSDIVLNKSIIFINLINWFNLGILYNNYSLRIDLIVSSMLIMIYLVSFCVHLFSCSYMDGDPHLPRFMSYLSLFTFFMIILITSSNLIQLFIGWEGVGLCSYLLINFWFTRIQANKSAIKAMIINKVGDMGLLIGIIFIWSYSGSFEFSEIFMFFSINNNNDLKLFIPLIFILIGVIGKSAQIGLHMWLPDAMEGPTPVSALIHAATMVTAGVFLIIRLSPIFDLTPQILIIIVFIGSLTSFFSAIIGLTQNDLKKVIAYSTCSQLGYMVTICGFSFYNSSLFHLINHGFFKALLFLSAGSIIHSLSDEQDFRKMGGLKIFLPLSYSLIVIGSLSLMGLPFLTGFYSKDLIIELINSSNKLYFSFILSLTAAFFTAFYSFRLIFYTFFNKPQFILNKFRFIHEGKWLLILPLIFLGLFSILFGYFWQYIIFYDNFPIMVNNFTKFSPLIFSLISSISCLILGINLNKFWNTKTNNFINYFYNLSIYTWFFDILINFYLVKPFLIIGYSSIYKLIDNQILESFGPNYFYIKITNFSNSITKFHSGKVSSYIFFLSIFFIIFLIF